jgi:hypothetical protein
MQSIFQKIIQQLNLISKQMKRMPINKDYYKNWNLQILIFLKLKKHNDRPN